MHILIGLIVIGMLVAWFYQATQPPSQNTESAGNASSAAMPDGMCVAYISGGQLFCKTNLGPPRETSSPYIQETADRLARSKERHAWKQGTSFQVAAHGGVRDYPSRPLRHHIPKRP